MSNKKMYNTYHHMKRRCYDFNDFAYVNYGGRGIKVCERWLGKRGFHNFLADMGERPEGYSLDRIDVNGNYEPTNCRWASRETQNNNTRANRFITHGGKTLTLSQWAREIGVKRGTLAQRFHVYKWPIEKCLSGGY